MFFYCFSSSHAYVHTYTDDELTTDTNYDYGTDTTRRQNTDSTRQARTHVADSTKEARLHATDSVKAVRQRKADSTATVRKYRNSKHYKDSVAHARVAKTKSLKGSRQGHLDSVKEARTAANMAVKGARKAKTDSVKAVQKHRTDSLARIRKYKTSRRYADSVAIVRHEQADSIKEARQAIKDSITTARKHVLDSTKTSRKHIADSIKIVRTRYTDSLKTVRKHRTDSLAKVKAEKERLTKAKEKANIEKKKAIYELKIKQKHDAWSNKSMLKKSWSPLRRFTQNSFTHYNYYYNANRKMEEAMLNMQRTRKENYDSLIGLYPFNPNRDSAMLKADMDSIIRKVSVGIQIHDPRTKWGNDMYLLLGQANYYKGRYDQGATAFRYIISSDEEKERKEAAANGHNYSSNNKEKEEPSVMEDEHKGALDFLKHKSVHNEAILWLARTYSTAGQEENAGAVISLLESDPKMPDDLRGRLALEKASVYLSDNNYSEASQQLSIAANDDNLPSWQRMRAAFLNGQIQQNAGQYTDASASYDKVLDYYPKPEMEFYARRNLAYCSLLSGTDANEALRPLKSVLHDGKFVSYYDQVYFVMGNLALKANNKGDAVNYFTKSATTPKATRKQKAISFASLGNIYYSDGDYTTARMYYDSSVKYSSSASNDSLVAIAVRRSKGLAEIATPQKVIHDQDSLLALSTQSRKEQLAAVRNYLKYLERALDDSLQNMDNAGVNSVTQQDHDNDNSTNSDLANWYFSNPVTMQQGSAEFKRKWGTRPLTDNWGRAAAQAYANNQGQNDDLAGADNGQTSDNGLPTEESLLAKIPNKPAQRELAIKVEQRAYIMLAKAYMKQLEDYKQAIHTLDTLDTRYPNQNMKEEELYMRYQIAILQNKLDKAQKYSQELLDKFPNSQYANTLRPKQDESGSVVNNNGKPVNMYYDETYSIIMQHQYTEGLMRIGTARQQYNNPVYKKRFDVAEVLCYAGSGNLNKADTLIANFIRNNPNDSLTGWANSIQDYIKDVRKNGVPSWYNDSSYFKEDNIALKNKKKKKTPPPPPPPPPVDVPPAYTYKPDEPHYCMLLLPGLDSRSGGLKKAIVAFDAKETGADSARVMLDMYGTHAAGVVIKGFANATQARGYIKDLKASDALQAYSPDEVRFLMVTPKNYIKMYYDKDVQSYLKFYNSNY